MTRSNMFNINHSDGYRKLLFHFLMEGAHFYIMIGSGVCSKTCVNGHSEKSQNLVFKTNYRLMQGKSNTFNLH